LHLLAVASLLMTWNDKILSTPPGFASPAP